MNNLGTEIEDSNSSYELLKLPDIKEILNLKKWDRVSISWIDYTFEGEEWGIFYFNSLEGDLFAVDKQSLLLSIDTSELSEDIKKILNWVIENFKMIMDSYPEENPEALKMLNENWKFLQ